MPKFEKTYCINCGAEFGPGDHGFSHCFSHMSADDQIAYLHESLEDGASADDVKNLACISHGNNDMILAFAEAWFNRPTTSPLSSQEQKP
jgi:hypothetical protein